MKLYGTVIMGVYEVLKKNLMIFLRKRGQISWSGHHESRIPSTGFSSSPSTNRQGYPLVMTNSLLLKWPIEIVGLPLKDGDVEVRKLLIYQRV